LGSETTITNTRRQKTRNVAQLAAGDSPTQGIIAMKYYNIGLKTILLKTNIEKPKRQLYSNYKNSLRI